jgi:hypothetical protein
MSHWLAWLHKTDPKLPLICVIVVVSSKLVTPSAVMGPPRVWVWGNQPAGLVHLTRSRPFLLHVVGWSLVAMLNGEGLSHLRPQLFSTSMANLCWLESHFLNMEITLLLLDDIMPSLMGTFILSCYRILCVSPILAHLQYDKSISRDQVATIVVHFLLYSLFIAVPCFAQ